jgi:hypothetical protein
MSVMRSASAKAVYWSLWTTVSGTNIGTGIVQSVDFGEEADEKVIKGADGATQAIIFSDPRQTMTIEIIPSGATETLARAASVLPNVGGSVTVADAGDPEIASSNWIFISGSKRRSVDSESVLTFNLRKYETALNPVGA